MKTVVEVERRVRLHVTERWADEVASESTGEQKWWPRAYPLGRPDARMLEIGFGDLIELVDSWRTQATAWGADIVERNIRADGTAYPMPSHIVIPSINVAAAIAGPGWTARLARGREYGRIIDAQFPHRRDVLARTILATADWTRVDVGLLAQAASWFEQHPRSGLSPREVPLEGLHTKWLESRTQTVARLAGLSDLGLHPPHPSRIHFTYLDPAHLEAGNRRHDSATVGDAFKPAYPPQIVIICENKDTAIHFPQVRGAIAVEGAGSGAGAFADTDWLRQAPLVIYWGDMDADGLRILAQFRDADIPARSLFMDIPSYERWELYGTNSDKRGNPIAADPRPAPANLEHDERALYELLNDPSSARYRRVEQERIPLDIASDTVRRLQAQIDIQANAAEQLSDAQ